MAFEVAILGATCWNSLDRPRVANETLARALRRDGILYFACVAHGIQCPPHADEVDQRHLDSAHRQFELSGDREHSLRVHCHLVRRSAPYALLAYSSFPSASWAIVTLIVSRLLLRLHALDRELLMPRPRPRNAPIFPARPSADHRGKTSSQLASNGAGSRHSLALESWEMGSCGAVEIGKVELVVDHR
jgi:hypothetical protein